MAIAAGQNLGALRLGILDVLDNLCHRVFADQWAGGHAVTETVADLHLANGSGEFFGKRVIDAGLHVDPVGADAGLAVVAVFRDHRAFDRGIEIGVVEDDERRIAAKLHRGLLDLVCGLAHQDPADFGRAGKRDLADLVVGAEFLADRSTRF
ncbi:MAG: hypothetical protein HoeaKO_40840 [Hoeflea alexandrii]